MTVGLNEPWVEIRGDEVALSDTLLKGMELCTLRRGRLKELLD